MHRLKYPFQYAIYSQIFGWVFDAWLNTFLISCMFLIRSYITITYYTLQDIYSDQECLYSVLKRPNWISPKTWNCSAYKPNHKQLHCFCLVYKPNHKQLHCFCSAYKPNHKQLHFFCSAYKPNHKQLHCFCSAYKPNHKPLFPWFCSAYKPNHKQLHCFCSAYKPNHKQLHCFCIDYIISLLIYWLYIVSFSHLPLKLLVSVYTVYHIMGISKVAHAHSHTCVTFFPHVNTQSFKLRIIQCFI